MLTLIIILILLPITFLPLALETLFSSNELSEMGICLEGAEAQSDHLRTERKSIVTPMCVTCVNS